VSTETQPAHHPEAALLAAVAAGGADAPLRLLVEAHVAGCARCARVLGVRSDAAAALAAQLPAAMEAPEAAEARFARIWARVAEAEAAPWGRPYPEDLLPKGLAAELPAAGSWGTAGGPGCEHLELMPEAPGRPGLYLVRMAPGATFPEHVHAEGEEAVVVRGGCTDRGVAYGEGDWAVQAPGSAHGPTADPEGCWLLVRVSPETLRFRGWRGPVLRAGLRARRTLRRFF
jgi:putative transcriptional regulator